MNDVKYISYDMFEQLVETLATSLKNQNIKKIWGVPKNGCFVVLSLVKHGFTIVNEYKDADVIIDDLIDSGKTREQYKKYNFEVLVKKPNNTWIQWWFEQESEKDIEDSVVRMLEYIKENPNREGLLETPKRVVKMWSEIFKGYDLNNKPKLTIFNNGYDGIKYDEMIIDNGDFVSFCEHHMLPFYGKYYFAYIPNGKVIGLSKVARIIDYYASKLQVQERLVKEILDDLELVLKPVGIALILKATHMCKSVRGIKNNGTMITSDIRGAFKEQHETRMEFMNLINKV